MKEARLTSDVIKRIKSAKTAKELLKSLEKEGIVKNVKEAEETIKSTDMDDIGGE